ncbi:phosphatidylinositol diacylglycerol-lyase [Lysinibacillus sphaericus OT4b.31]|uniref:1-phosphatidylinositol phosphodiesterase n=1 Tax=Lysinibacillus sphaericus OT4b.31 TaxID=1285586 RepID=R7ZHM3_LYSSH|nr:phosphatidylinositol diacylglycerol-lyase [Lysinibacillus sphaericus OT4b.31]
MVILKSKNVIASMCVLFTVLFSSVGAHQTSLAASERDNINLSEWMREIPNSNTLAEISIPGTHDSGTFRLEDPIKSVWAKTQENDFRYQMDHGVRFFDIRGRVTDDNTIVLHHGPIYLYVTLQQFINEAKEFLKSHPSETIIMSLKEEYESMPGAKESFAKTFENMYFGDSIFLKTEGNITLGDSRGKIVLLRRYSGSTMTGGFKNFGWKDNATFTSTTNGNVKITVQDKYNVNYEEKKAAIDSMLKETVLNKDNPNHIHINFTSLSSGGTAWSSPYYYASYLNSISAAKVRLDHLKNLDTKAGWIIMDYIGDRWDPKLYEEIIRANFRYPPTDEPHLFEHIDGEGIDFTNLPHSKWNDQVSSILLKSYTEITIYEHSNFTGKSVTLTNTTNSAQLFNLTTYNFNDKMSSYTWKLIR